MSDLDRRFADLVEHFPNVERRSATKCVGTCPSCGKDEHFYITLDADSGKALVHCQHCQSKDVADYLRPVGLNADDLNLSGNARTKSTTVNSKAKKAGHGREVERRVYDYFDNMLSIVARKTIVKHEDGHKDAFWQHPDKHGTFVRGRNKKLSTPLYNQQSVFHSRGVQCIIVVEGEKDVETLRTLLTASKTGIVSTPDGAMKNADSWSDNWTPYFEGRDVFIIQDNDDAGRLHADIVARKVFGVASSVRIVDLCSVWAECPDKGDISDYVERMGDEGNDRQAIYKAVTDALMSGNVFDVNTPPPVIKDNQSEQRTFTAVRMDTVDDVPTSWIWKPYIIANEVTLMSGFGGDGKTTVLCKIAADITRGYALPTEDGSGLRMYPENVLFISAEDSASDVRPKFAECGADMTKVFIVDNEGSIGMTFDDLPALITAYNPRLVVLDPWHAFVGENVDVNRQNQLRPVLQRLTKYARDGQCGIVLIAHVNKRAQGENANNAVAGSVDLVNASRSVLQIVRDPEDENGDTRLIVHTKSNRAKAGKTVRFAITGNGGAEWDGFSDVTRFTLEGSARHKQSLREYLQTVISTESRTTDIVETIVDLSIRGKTVNVTFERLDRDRMKPIGFWMSGRPSRVLRQQQTTDALNVYGVTLSRIGDRIRDDTTPADRNAKRTTGFCISRVALPTERQQISTHDIEQELIDDTDRL